MIPNYEWTIVLKKDNQEKYIFIELHWKIEKMYQQIHACEYNACYVHFMRFHI